MAKQSSYQPNYAVCPGDVLDEHRQSAGLTQDELAKRLGFSVKHVNRIIGGSEPVTPDTALKLEAVLGLPAHVWIGLEAQYREFHAREDAQQALANELEWLTSIPHRAMAKLGWIPDGLSKLDTIRALRDFFRVGSLHFLPDVWAEVNAAYRKTEAFKTHEWALLAWLAQGERLAEAVNCQPYDASALRAALPELKALTRIGGIDFVEPLVTKAAALGVAVVFLPAPAGARVCGATRWLSKDKALVQLSLRYKTDDQLWFTFFHELGHVLLHRKRDQFIDFVSGASAKSEQEMEADDFASRTLVAPGDLARFITKGDFSPAAVREFSLSQGVADGIVVGQLQHRRFVTFNSPLSKLKQSYRWDHERAGS